MGVFVAAYRAATHIASGSLSSGGTSAASHSATPPGEASPLHGFPTWLLVIMALSCLLLAACASGMTLGYMSLDTIGLEIVMNGTNAREAAAAKVILPVRKQGNLLLCTLLLTNTMATELLPLVLEALYPGGIFALVTSVLSLILFSEILPQSICSRHALEIGAYMIQFVKLLRILLYPVAAPIAYLLDLMLGQELGTIYDRDGLKGLIDVHARSKYGVLTEDETEIMKGTLDFSLKTVEDAMTRAEDVYMLDVDSTLNRKTVNEMLTRGHSRIPLYEHDRNNVVCLLLLKQLVFVDVDDNLPIRALINKKKRNRKVRVAPALYCLPGAKLSEVLREFQRGRSHMAIVFDKMAGPNEAGTLLGIVTMEDLIEELIGNINDETDVYISNESKDPVLVRGADGKLKRVTHTRTRLPGTSTVVLKEIDVDRLKQPLIASLRGQKLVPDWRRPVRYGSVSHAKSMPLDAADGGAPSALRRPRVAEGLPPSDNASDDPEAGVDAEDVADLESQELRRLRHRQLSLPDPDAIVPSVAEAVEPGSRASVRGTSVRWKEWTSGDPNSPSGEGITCAPPPARSESRKYGADGGLRPMHLSLDISKFPETVQSDDET